jgi:hypothetical protein
VWFFFFFGLLQNSLLPQIGTIAAVASFAQALFT